MFVELALLVLLAFTVGALVIKALKTALSFLGMSGGKKGQQVAPQEQNATGKGKTDKKEKQKEKSEKEEHRKDVPEEEEKKEEVDTLAEEQRLRYEQAARGGITEHFWTEGSTVEINGKDFADRCVSDEALTYLEVNNRDLAGDRFFGFNVIIEDGKKMTLTFHGSAIASLTRIEKEATAVINGETVKGTQVMYRTNTFPPKYASGMLPDDIERMLAACHAVNSCGGDPELVATAMRQCFTDGENIARLRGDIVPKIQTKESQRQRRSQTQTKKVEKPLRMAPAR